jgi:hypothetical protein
MEIRSRFGKAEKMEQIGRRVIRDYMPDEHQEFFSRLPYLLVGSVDLAGRPWAPVLAGPPSPSSTAPTSPPWGSSSRPGGATGSAAAKSRWDAPVESG